MKSAKSIIKRDINNFALYFADQSADAGLHVVVGKIGLAAELQLISLNEMGEYIDLIFIEHAKTKK
jgi:hypothetical protein